jgi:uncharacterized membrane protein
VTSWAVLVLAAGTYVFKASGPLALGARTVPPPLQRALTLLSVTLLAALVAIGSFGDGRALALDARAAGLAVSLGAVWLRAPVRRRRDRRDRHRSRSARARRRLARTAAELAAGGAGLG